MLLRSRRSADSSVVGKSIATTPLKLVWFRSAFSIVALAAVLVLAVRLVIGAGAAPDQWKVNPGPVAVKQSAATPCFKASPAVNTVRSVGAVDLVRFAGQRGFIKLQFLANEDEAIQAAYTNKSPWVENNTIWSQVPARNILKRDAQALSACLNIPPPG